MNKQPGNLLSHIAFLVIFIGAILLNCTSPPWQYIGVAIFLIAMLYPALEAIVDLQ